MLSEKIKIMIPSGLQARPVAVLVQVASQYDSNIYVQYEEKRVNAKSIMGMMSLRLVPGNEITIVTNGADEVAAAEGIEKFLVNVKNR